MKVKICGITDVETAKYTAAMGADAIGFVFAPSRRRVSPEWAKEMIVQLPNMVEKVGVFVNESPHIIEEIATYCGLTMIQLHGEESKEMCDVFSVPVIKAVGIGSRNDLEKALGYPCSYILVDSPKGQQYYGGNGETFDWRLLEGMEEHKHKMILAGGLHENNVRTAIQTIQPYMVDVSSGVETDGRKDWGKIKSFLQAAKGEGER